MIDQKKTSRLWLRNTSRYSNAELWPLISAAFKSTKRNLLAGESMPRIIVDVTNCHSAFRGRAGWIEWHPNRRAKAWHRILVRMGPPERFETPIDWTYGKFKDMPEFRVINHREAIVAITAHEMEHAVGAPGNKQGEVRCEMNAWDAVDYYRSRRDEIDAQISAYQQTLSQREQRAAESGLQRFVR
jgi:hypothetical protein